MKLLVVLSCLVAAALCAPPPSKAYLRSLPALRHEEVHDEFGQYAFRFVTAEGTVRHERGYLKTAANGKVIMVIEGEYQYIDENGKLFARKYKADEFGFHIDTDFAPVKGSLTYESEVPLQIAQAQPAVANEVSSASESS